MGAQPNIGPKQRKLRMVLGIVAVLGTMAAAVPVFLVPLHPAWAWLLFVPAFVASLSLEQAAEGT